MTNKQKILTGIAIAIVLLIFISIRAKAKYMSEVVNENDLGGGNFYAPQFNGIPGSKNFKLAEFHCKDGTPVPADLYGNLQLLIENLQVLRDEINLPIHINSGYRTPAHNAKEGGAPNSMHLQAAAADIVVVGMGAAAVRTKINDLIKAGKMRNGGIGSYSTFTHYDVGPVRRWTNN